MTLRRNPPSILSLVVPVAVLPGSGVSYSQNVGADPCGVAGRRESLLVRPLSRAPVEGLPGEAKVGS